MQFARAVCNFSLTQNRNYDFSKEKKESDPSKFKPHTEDGNWGVFSFSAYFTVFPTFQHIFKAGPYTPPSHTH